MRDRAAFAQPLHTGRFDARQLERRLVALDIGRGTIVIGLIGPWIDDEQKIALLDQAALLEGDLVNVSRDARTDLHRLHRLKAAGELVPILDALLDDRGNAHLRRRGRSLRRTARSSAADLKGRNCDRSRKSPTNLSGHPNLLLAAALLRRKLIPDLGGSLDLTNYFFL